MAPVKFQYLQVFEDIFTRLLARNAKQMDQSEVEGQPGLTVSFVQLRFTRCDVKKQNERAEDINTMADMLCYSEPLFTYS